MNTKEVRQFEDERRFNLAGGDNTAAMTEAYAYFGTSDVRLLLTCKMGKDYLTGGTPEPQIGSDAVQILL